MAKYNGRRTAKRKEPVGLYLIAAALAVILIVLIVVALQGHGDKQPPTPSGSGTPSFSNPPTTGAPKPGKSLSVTSELGESGVVTAEKAVFSGTSDPNKQLTVNGQAVNREADGSFQCTLPLEMGVNEIKFVCGDESKSFTLDRRYAVLSFTPEGERSYHSGATVYFQAAVKKGSRATVQFNGATVELKEDVNQQGLLLPEGHVLLTGSHKLPDLSADQQLGKAVLTNVCDGITETLSSGEITGLKAANIQNSDPSVTPGGGSYIDVGSGYIAEVLLYSAETFDGNTTDDFSHPTNTYLPKGTVDYCSTQMVKNGSMQYVLLRCGKRVYLQKRNTPSSDRTTVVDRYSGTLPDHNEIGVASFTQEGHHTVLTLDCLWKAPFRFDFLPQSYDNPKGGADRSYKITACTATHIDITFCYATVHTGTVDIPADHPLFSKAEWIDNQSDCTLRLHLKKEGVFYGWDSYYNDQDQLCFRFLNPITVTKADNGYGASLEGITVLIDVGHGGRDGGAEGVDSSGKRWEEAERNLALANALCKELEGLGATVVMNRTEDVVLRVDERVQMLKNLAPDICIAVHHNSLTGNNTYSGFECFYYYPWSQKAASLINERTKATGIYRSGRLDWNNYFTCRQTACPVVLTENGFISTPKEADGIADPATLTKKAKAITQGIVDYYLGMQE